MKNLKTFSERLNCTVSRVEILQRQTFNQFIRHNKKSNSHGLSISCGDGIWDYLALKGGVSIIDATDIVANPVSHDEQKN